MSISQASVDQIARDDYDEEENVELNRSRVTWANVVILVIIFEKRSPPVTTRGT